VVEEGLGDAFGQFDGDVRFEWGPTGAAYGTPSAGCLVVVDVLSFTTSVTVCAGRGIAVIPHPWGDPDVAEFAAAHDAQLAVRRREVSTEHPWSVSPAALRTAPVTPRLVMPSPNGSTVAAAAAATARAGTGTGTGITVVAACLRNAGAVAAWLLAHRYGTSARSALVVAAGERWQDGSLRPALEDALGAGAVLHHLSEAGCTLSVEAAAMAAMFGATPDVAAAVHSCGSAQQLVGAGYGTDVEVAAQLDTDELVPVLDNGAFSAL
jgi:2-phosphosulfolactate phosphatase